MSAEPLKLPPAPVYLPDKIVAMIAEACVDESFPIKVDKYIEKGRPWKAHMIMISKLPASYVAAVSRDFRLGVNRGRQNNSHGVLILPVGYIKVATEILEKRGLGYVILKMEKLHLRHLGEECFDPDHQQDVPRYINIGDVILTYKHETVFLRLLSLIHHDPRCRASRLLKLLSPFIQIRPSRL